MLEGELIFQVEDALETKRAGELSFAPRNVAHALANHSNTPARYLLVCTPAGFERHWARLAAEAAGVEPPRWALGPIPEVTVVGPPILPDQGAYAETSTGSCSGGARRRARSRRSARRAPSAWG